LVSGIKTVVVASEMYIVVNTVKLLPDPTTVVTAGMETVVVRVEFCGKNPVRCAHVPFDSDVDYSVVLVSGMSAGKAIGTTVACGLPRTAEAEAVFASIDV
jgi:hypothetical protein